MAEQHGDDGAHSTAMVKDGVSALPDQDGKDQAAKELDDAHDHADPAKDVERANVTPVDQGCGVAEKDKKL